MAVNPVFANELVILAQSHRDEALQNDGLELNLEEDPNLELPFLIPQLGYSCDTIRGIPPGLQDYFEPMISAGETDTRVMQPFVIACVTLFYSAFMGYITDKTLWHIEVVTDLERYRIYFDWCLVF